MKKKIRSAMIDMRNNNFSNLKSEMVCKNIIKKFSDYDNIAIYMSIGSEVSLDFFIAFSLNSNKKLFIPKVVGQTLEFGILNSSSQISKGYNGVDEPVITEKDYLPELIIMPGLAFDRSGGRLGYGKGYYDRYLENKRNITKVGISYDFQIIDNVFTMEHDIKMDYIITESEIIQI